MKICVTGGAGFIGSHLVERLLSDGYDVVVLDDLSTGEKSNLADGVPLMMGDVADFDVVKEAVTGCDSVYHEAALVSVPQSIEEPIKNQMSNVQGTFNVFEAARQAGIKRVVCASSAAIYGNAPGLPKRETDTPAPVTPYASAKLMGEQLAAAYNHSYGMEITCLRYMNVYGARQNPGSPYSGVLSIFCNRAMANQGVKIFGDGEQTRDFVHVSDVVEANILAGTRPFDIDYSVFNVGRGQQTSLNQIVEALRGLTGNDVPVTYEDERTGDIRHSVADISRIRSQLGFKPFVDLESGLEETLNWLGTS